MNENIPAHAQPVRYDYGKQKGVYFIWETNRGFEWWALGHGNIAATKEIAARQAYDWIVNNKIRPIGDN